MIGKLLACGLACAGMALGQTATAPASASVVASTAATTTAASAAPTKAYSFDVVSIRKNVSEAARQSGPGKFGPTPDGFRMTGSPFGLAIIMAYVPQAGGSGFFTLDRVKGLPDWAMAERYDIDARVGEANLAEWQKPAAQKAMQAAMLQEMLADRCKLAVHREINEIAVYALVVGKGGPKFKETNPDEAHPGASALPGGGMIIPNTGQGGMSLYGVSMTMLSSMLSDMAYGERPIQDKTELTGRYDITLKPFNSAESVSDIGSSIFSAVEELGLKLVSAKGQVETLVIDHMERPSEN